MPKSKYLQNLNKGPPWDILDPMFEHCPTFTVRRRIHADTISTALSIVWMDSTLKCLESCSLVVYDHNGTSQNEDFACHNPPSVTLVSFGCCVLLAVSLTGWCRWLVGGAFTCVHC